MRIEEVRVGCAPVPMRQPMKTAIHATTHTYNALVQIAAAGVTGEERPSRWLPIKLPRSAR